MVSNPVLQAQMEAEGAIVLILYIPVMGMYMDFTSLWTRLSLLKPNCETQRKKLKG
jgi:hypothetical protein